MGVAVQKGAGQGILRGDGALGQIGGGQSGQQLHNGKAAARFGDRHAQQGRHLAERVWYGTGNGKGNTVPGFQCGAGGRRLQNNGIGLQGGIVADIIDGTVKPASRRVWMASERFWLFKSGTVMVFGPLLTDSMSFCPCLTVLPAVGFWAMTMPSAWAE